jgi:hypothetical protein
LELALTAGPTLRAALKQGVLAAETTVLAGPVGSAGRPPRATDARAASRSST